MTHLRRHRLAIAMLAVWALSLWIANHSGLALMIQPNGEKSCIDLLSLTFGFDHTVLALATLSRVGMLLTICLPIAGLIWLLRQAWQQHRQARQQQS